MSPGDHGPNNCAATIDGASLDEPGTEAGKRRRFRFPTHLASIRFNGFL
jgi:hypothetical protein